MTKLEELKAAWEDAEIACAAARDAAWDAYTAVKPYRAAVDARDAAYNAYAAAREAYKAELEKQKESKHD